MASTYKRGETYWGRATHKGTEHRKSLKTTSREVAKQRLAAWLKLIEGAEFGEREAHTFDEAAVKFIDEHLPTIKKRSADRYIVSIANLTKSFEGLDLSAIGSAHLNEFVTRRRGAHNPKTKEKLSGATIRRDLACLSSIFGMAIEWEWLDVNPVGPFLKRMKRRNLKESPARQRYLSHKEERDLIAAASPYIADGIRFAIDTGLRKEEQFSREWRHVDFARNEITIHGSTSKNAKDRRVPMLPRSRALLQVTARSDIPFVFWHTDKKGRYHRRRPRRFLTMDRGLKAAARRAGIPDLRWHDLRRTCGCRLLQDHGLSIEKVSKWLGHSSSAITERAYAFLNVEHLHKAIERAPALERPLIEGEVSEVGNAS